MDNFTDLPSYLKLLASLTLVLGLMGGLALLLKKLGLAGQVASASGQQKRLKVIEAVALDARRRLVLLQRDDVQHLVILGAESETVIETAIKPLDNIPHE
ncbi:MAG: flagellar biosynthetic protein FliO [Alphaproteobacteria bacterium]|nr:flagellar biosynthetic protein FliO [Alphaproteobacteria bacterium]